MIQRKQSLFLLAVAIIAILLFLMPFLTIDVGGESYGLTLLGGFKYGELISAQIYIPFMLNVIVLLGSILTIFQFKKRVLQYKLANLVALLSVFTTGMFFLLNFFKEPSVLVHFAPGAFFPLLGAVLAFLAGHYIKKDEQLVRSADRLR